VRRLNENFGALGYFIIGLFALSWIFSIVFYRWRRYDELEVQAEVEMNI
jgi:high-affinity nickel-transport protein